jgi:hypothetical protein
MISYILSESTRNLDCMRCDFFANEPLCFIKINPHSIEHGIWSFLNEPLDFK